MKTIFIFLAITFFSAHTWALTKKDSIKTANVLVIATNTANKPLVGELVSFKSSKTSKVTSYRTDALGKISLKLPVGDEYNITIQSLNDSMQYGVLPIASLGEGESYTDAFTVNITYEPAKNFTLNNVFFDFGKASLRPESYKELNELYEYMKWKENEKIEIAGHTDNVGNDNDNLKLSQARAEAVKNYLIKKGIAQGRIIAKGYGATKPIAENNSDENRQRNRRTEVKILA